MSVAKADPRLERRLRVGPHMDPLRTIAALWQGPGDPQMRLAGRSAMRAMRLPSGPATVAFDVAGGEVTVGAWGPGAVEALNIAPGLIGLDDDPRGLVARHPLVADLIRRLPGLRLTRGGPVMESLVPSILGQKVTGTEARHGHRELLIRHGETAPGPLGLRLPPPPEKLARMPYWAFHLLGVERRRADAIRAAAAVAPALERIRGLSPSEGRRRLLSVPGIGPWTAAETMRLALGDPDAVSVGDFHLPRLVGWALARERYADDSRMLELLEPYVGQRARVVMLLENGGIRIERHGPRLAPRSIAAI
jgi:3-methyladenine DNA glycosylase/8-oxoguanine DNA glycosylase